MSHVFISYSTQNSEYAYQLADKLREEGFDIWIDNDELRASDNWVEAIFNGVEGCAAFVVIMTPEARASKWVQREVSNADQWNKPIFPMLLWGKNWPIFVNTQFENVVLNPNPNELPQYAGKPPSPAFYNKLAQYAPRKPREGKNVVETGSHPKIDEETANPQPITEIASDIGNEIEPEVTTPPLEIPPPAQIVSSAKHERKPVGSTTSGKKPPGTLPKRPTTSHRKRTLFLSGMFLLILVSGIYSIFSGILARPNATNDLPTLIVLPTASNLCQNLAQTPPANANQIAFASNRDGNYEIYLMNDDGSGLCRLTDYFSSEISPTWSPDGRQIAFVSFRDGNAEIYSMNVDGGNLARLTTNLGSDRDPVWSPDGSRIAFVSARTGNSEIYVMNTDGTDIRRLTNSSTTDYFPTWSPDSLQIAFTSYRDENAEIYITGINGVGLHKITENSVGDFSPAWSPDGRQIAFRSYGNGNQEIYVMNVGGTGLRRITADPAADDAPAWSPNSRQIAFESQRDGNFEIYVMSNIGDNEQNITHNAANDKNPVWRPAPKT